MSICASGRGFTVVQFWVRWRFSDLIILRNKKELIIRLDRAYYFTSGNTVRLRKIGPENVKISQIKGYEQMSSNCWIHTTVLRHNFRVQIFS